MATDNFVIFDKILIQFKKGTDVSLLTPEQRLNVVHYLLTNNFDGGDLTEGRNYLPEVLGVQLNWGFNALNPEIEATYETLTRVVSLEEVLPVITEESTDIYQLAYKIAKEINGNVTVPNTYRWITLEQALIDATAVVAQI